MTRGKGVGSSFSPEKDDANQDHGEKMLTGQTYWESLEVEQTRIERNEVQGHTEEVGAHL